MSFPGSVLLLLSVCLFVAMPYAIGHGMASHNNTAIVIGLVAGAIGIALFLMQSRSGRRSAHH